MKTLFATIILAGIFSCQSPNPAFKSVSVEAYERIIADSSVVRLDVRTAKEFAEGHIAKTINIDVLKNDFESKAVAMLPKNHIIAVNCRSGKRSKNAARILVKNGFKVIELDGGYNDWVKNRMPVTK